MDPTTIGPTIVQELTHKEPFGRLKKEQIGMMRVKIGTQSKRMERVMIGPSTKAHCSKTVHGLRTIGLLIGGMTTAVIGLRIGHGTMIRCGSGLLSIRLHCRHRLR